MLNGALSLQDQWQRKKQTKEEARNAKKAKLDPDSVKTAKDVMEENAKKRKRENADGDEDADEDADEAGSVSELSELGGELPREGLKRFEKQNKKQKKDEESTEDVAKPEATDVEREERKKQKLEKKAEKKERQKQRLAEKLEKQKPKDQTPKESGEKKEKKPKKNTTGPVQPDDTPKDKDVPTNDDNESDNDVDARDEMAPIEGFALDQNLESTAPTSPSNSNTLDSSNAPSATSSTSSIVPPSDAAQKTDTSSSKPLKITSEEQKQRLRKKIEELRARRHADGLDGKPARNRAELMEARRQAEQKRREAKKEQRQKEREEEQQARDDAITKRFSPHGSLLNSPGSPADSITSISNNFSFGRVMFADGQQVDPSLSGLREQKKKRGPQDPATALKAAQAKKTRLDAMDEEKRAGIEEKDMWLKAKKRAHGERVKDDINLLKKSVDRNQITKKRSETQWQERIDGVKKGQEMKQKKREDNLRKRREGKGNKGNKPVKGKAKARPGFEGSFKTKAGKK